MLKEDREWESGTGTQRKGAGVLVEPKFQTPQAWEADALITHFNISSGVGLDPGNKQG